MTDPDTRERSSAPDGGPDARGLVFVALAVVGLVTLAFVAPAASPDAENGGEVEPEGGEPPPGLLWLLELLAALFDGGDPICEIRVHEQPVPGQELPVTVTYDGEPAADATVWFNDERVGVTDGNGTVVGEVPFESELVVRADLGEGRSCAAGTETAAVPVGHAALGGIATTDAGLAGAGSTTTAPTEPRTLALGDNATGEYPVTGVVVVEVLDDPYPGEAVRVRVTITAGLFERHPVEDARVSLDGDPVATTDEAGIATVTLPDDGTETVTLTASRGEFEGTTTVELLVLDVGFDPDGLVAIPGAPGAIEASLGPRPAPDATVTVGGEPFGTTDEDGAVGDRLPSDPTAPVVAETADQRAETTLAAALAIPVGLWLVGTVVATGALARFRSRRAAWAAPALAVGVAATVVVHAFLGDVVLLVALASLVVGSLVAFAVRHRRGLRRGAGTTAERAATLPGLFVTGVLRLARGLDRLVDRTWAALGSLRRRLAALRRAGLEALPRLVAWLRSVPRRTLHAVGRLRANPRAVVAGLLALALLVGGYAVFGGIGLAAATALLAVVVVGWLLWRRGDAADDDGQREPADARAVPDEPTTVRGHWRRFARRVEPTRWRTSSPGEIARSALAKGYPAGPVRRLTRLFREIEFGGREPTETRRREARDTVRELTSEDDDRRAGGGERGG